MKPRTEKIGQNPYRPHPDRHATCRSGFTLIELTISVALVAILTGVLFVLLNPAQQMKNGRNQARQAHLQTILGAIGQNRADNRGTFNCAAGALPTTTKKMAVGAGNYDIANCLVPTYLPSLPFDPFAAGAHYTSGADYDTGYNIVQSATTSWVTASAPSAELGATITYTR